MVRVINGQNAAMYASLLDAMHKDRKRVFIDTLRWNLPHEAERELDIFDDEHAEYLIVTDRMTGDHLASLRLLRTDRPHLMSEVFPFLCENGVPGGSNVREVTRFCLSPRLPARDRLRMRNVLVNDLIRHATALEVSALTGVSQLGFLNQILSAGWQCIQLGLPQSVNGSAVGAFQINVDPTTLASLCPAWRAEPALLRLLEFDQPLAA